MQCNKCINKKRGCWIRNAATRFVGCAGLSETEISLITRASADDCDLFDAKESKE